MSQQAKKCIEKVMDMIVDEGVGVARNFAQNTKVVVKQDGVTFTTTVYELMKNNAEKRLHS